MPVDEHACSVSLPTWSAVVGYEEGHPGVVKAMQCGYPRFVYHPYLLQLMNHVLQQQHDRSNDDDDNASMTDYRRQQQLQQQQDCLLLPSIHAARRCQIFLLRALWGDDYQQQQHYLPDPAAVARQPAAQVMAEAAATSDVTPIKVVSVNNSNSTTTSKSSSQPNHAEVYAVLFPATTAAGTQAKAYWQHTGEVVSSRRAQACLQDLNVPLQRTITAEQFTCHQHHGNTSDSNDGNDPTTKLDAWTQLRQSLASWAGTSPEDVILTPSGMAAVYVALQSARRRHLELHPHRRGGKAVVYGFPYLDTLKLCSRHELCPDGVEFFGRADARDLTTLEAYLQANPDEISIVLTEVPSNPLLNCPDVTKLRELADQYNFLLVVDDTIANFLNVNLLSSGLADATVSSLTKLISGRGDAMAGSVVCNPNTTGGQWMQHDLAIATSEGVHSGLYCPDAMAVLRNAQDFPARNAQINTTTEALADWLDQHDAVSHVYYPKLSPSVDLYHQVQATSTTDDDKAGYGGLLSMVLAPHMCERTFYDALDVAKGPSLGTNFTLACPYTLLAHYHELDFAMSYDVPPNLIRVAVGLEPFEVLQSKFEAALSASRLYPRVCMDSVERRKQGQSGAKRNYSTWTAHGRGAVGAGHYSVTRRNHKSFDLCATSTTNKTTMLGSRWSPTRK